MTKNKKKHWMHFPIAYKELLFKGPEINHKLINVFVIYVCGGVNGHLDLKSKLSS